MAEYLPTNAVVSWTYAIGTVAGTAALTADWRTFNFNPTQERIDSTAGTHTMKSFVAGLKEFTADYSGLHQSSTGGTQVIAAFTLGQQGTITFQSQGTAAGLPKLVLPAMVTNEPVTKFQYNNLVEVNIAWVGIGDYTSGTN